MQFFLLLNVMFSALLGTSGIRIPASKIKKEIFTVEERDQRKLNPQSTTKSPRAAENRTLPNLAQNIGLNFVAATVEDVQVHFRPQPNCNGWVGPEQYILITNQCLRSFNNVTGEPDGILDIDSASFFGIPGFDVRIVYNRFVGRWFMSCEFNDYTNSGAYNLILAMSHDSVITKSTQWTIYTIPNATVNPTFPTGSLDYQQLSSSENAVLICVSTFQDLAEAIYAGSSAVVIQMDSLLAGGPLNVTVFPYLLPGVGDYPLVGQFEQFISPADNFDLNPQFGYIINAANYVYDFPTNDNIYNTFYFYRIENPGSTNPTLGPLIVLPAPNYADPANAPHKGNLFPGVGNLDTSFGTFEAAHVRNHQLYVVKDTQMDQNGVGNPAGDRVGIQWFQYDLTGDTTGRGLGVETATTVPVLIQSGTIFDNSPTNPKFYFLPSIMTNKNQDLVVIGTVSSVNDYVNVFYAGRKGTDPANELSAPTLVTKNTSLPLNYAPNVSTSPGPFVQRWGDLGSLSPEPINDLDLWLTNQAVELENAWGIRVAQLIPAN